jgi:hypothetical protein
MIAHFHFLPLLLLHRILEEKIASILKDQCKLSKSIEACNAKRLTLELLEDLNC